MALDVHRLFDIAFVVAVVVLVPVAVVYAQRRVRAQRADQDAQLRRRGHVRSVATRDGGGPVTRLWAFLPAPTPIYLRVSNFDAVAVMVGQMGVHDLKVGEPRFDAAFVVRSNHPDIARALLDEPTRRAFMRWRGIDFCTGGIANLLGADHYRERGDERQLRALWRLHVDGELDDAACAPLLALAQDLAARIELQSTGGGWVADDYRIGRWEAI